MRVRAVPPDPSALIWLPGTDFSDAFMTELVAPGLDSRKAAELLLLNQPRWIKRLMKLRNLLVRPFGLKRPEPSLQAHRGMIGSFPVIHETPTQIVLGFDDKHLDFRVLVDVLTAMDEKRKRVTVTTLVKRHNGLGRAYLALIKPFHVRVVRGMLDYLHP